LARSGDDRAPSTAEKILKQMDVLFHLGNTFVRPDTKSYNTVINAWAKLGEMETVSRAEHTLAEMTRRSEAGEHHLKPDTITYTTRCILPVFARRRVSFGFGFGGEFGVGSDFGAGYVS